jgi:hypothetical protein
MHKPIHKYVTEMVDELTKGYELIPKYHTNQKIIIPIVSSSSSDDADDDGHKKTTEELYEKSKRH